jgi:asparagine synthase (glutamine-hydrolysing)
LSGIAGAVALGGGPVDPEALARMAACLARRGPDGGGTRILEGCGLAHALLRTGDPVPAAAEPFTLDGRLWITADARLDGRDELARALRAGGEDAAAEAPAAELLLRAYRAWSTGCLERLLGDFAFAVWDAPRRRLFCARDALGLKLLYHASPPGAFVFSSSLACVLLHPGVGGALDEAAVADFLVYSYGQEPERTIRRDVRALAPGHALLVEDGRVRAWRWWSLPEDEPLPLRRPADVADAFVELLGEAVRDRMPAGEAALFLSGGRDSPAVAAMARRAVDRGERDTRLHAYTAFYRRLIPDDEPRYARMAAAALAIPVTWLAVDGYRPFDRFEHDPLLARPEPVDSPLLAIEVDQWVQAAAHARVLLTGLGGDPLLRETPSRLARLAARGRLLRAAFEAAQYARHHRRLPRPGVRTWLRGGVRHTPPAEVPPWIDPEFARRVGLAERIAARGARRAPAHPLRPEAAEQLASPFWPSVFAYYDPGVTGMPLEVRHPFFDLRLVRFALAVPPAQWYNDKGMLRIGMRERLPAPLLRRPKTPLRGDPFEARLREDGPGWLGGRTLGPEVDPWIDRRRVPRVAGGTADGAPGALWTHLRPLGLSLWLRRHEL